MNNENNQFGFNNNPNDMNNQNNFNQGMPQDQNLNNGTFFNQNVQPQPMPNMQPNPTPDYNSMNQGMQPNPGFNQSMPMNNGYNTQFNNVPNNGMDPNMNNTQMPFPNYGPGNAPVPTNNGNKKNTMLGIGIVVGVIVLIVVVVLVFGNFGSKTLTCEQTQSLGNIDMKIIEKIKYKKKGESTINSTIIYSKDGGFSDEEFDMIKDSLESSDSDDVLGEDVKITKDGDDIKITGTIKKEVNEKSYDELKESAEDDGFTCK